MPWCDILGHAEPLARLRAGAAHGRLAHAYAFVGPAGIGKKRFALEAAKCLLCERHADAELEACGTCPACQQVAARTHPDLFVVGLPEGKKVLPIKLFIGDKESRGQEGLCHELSLRPMSGRRRVAIIDDAECLNEESGNCLLKTLEEPPPDSLLILINAGAELTLPTIRSRCQMVAFQPLPEADVQTLLVRQGLVEQADEAAEIARLCEGSLDTARQLLEPQLRTARTALFELLAADPFLSVQTSARVNELIDAVGGETASQRETAGWTVRFAIEFFRRALLSLARGAESELPQVARFVSRFGRRSDEDLDRVAELLERCLSADRQFADNAMIPLCVETLFDDLGKILRRAGA